MKLVMTIAWRNILRHKGKSIIIGVILFLGALLMTVGNGVISGMDRGIERNIVDGFMGDIVLVADKQKSDNVLLNFMGTSIEPITTYPKIKEILSSKDYIDRFLPVGKNLAFALSDEGSFTPGIAFIIGVNFEDYEKMFPNNIKTVEGRFLKKGEHGILVPTDARKELYDYVGLWLVPEGGKLVKESLHKDALEEYEDIITTSAVVLMGMNVDNSSTDVLFPVKGIIRYRSLNTIFGHFSLCDIESYRECMGYFSAFDRNVNIPDEQQSLLEMGSESIDDMFASDSMFVDNIKGPSITIESKKTEQKAGSEEGAYNMVFVRLKKGAIRKLSLLDLNRDLAEKAAGARAVTWNKASGVIGGLATIIKGALFLFVTFLFVVAVIIIINTLTMSAIERVPEIGMMRAIGAKKSFIAAMFYGETAVLSAVFGGAGIIVGIIIVNAIPFFNITTANDFLQLLYGGDVFRPVLRLIDIIVTVLQLAGVTVVAALYPVTVAKNITPLDAIARD
ncbi:MAG: FtsX-like permease family protein [Endomicrobiales bacterium]|nr:FtsX-like permease family protein [Endomicrobiales bacterium]